VSNDAKRGIIANGERPLRDFKIVKLSALHRSEKCEFIDVFLYLLEHSGIASQYLSNVIIGPWKDILITLQNDKINIYYVLQ